MLARARTPQEWGDVDIETIEFNVFFWEENAIQTITHNIANNRLLLDGENITREIPFTVPSNLAWNNIMFTIQVVQEGYEWVRFGGISTHIVTKTYDELKSETISMESEFYSLQRDFESLQTSYTRMESEYTVTKADYDETLLQISQLERQKIDLEMSLEEESSRYIPGFPIIAVSVGLLIILFLLPHFRKH